MLLTIFTTLPEPARLGHKLHAANNIHGLGVDQVPNVLGILRGASWGTQNRRFCHIL